MPGLVVAPGLTPGGNAAGAARAGVRPAPQNGTGNAKSSRHGDAGRHGPAARCQGAVFMAWALNVS